MASFTASDFGYVRALHVELPNGYDFVPIGQVTKRGDEYYIPNDGLYGRWIEMKAEFLNVVVDASYLPVRRQRRWACWHKREVMDDFCPVCAVFCRHVAVVW